MSKQKKAKMEPDWRLIGIVVFAIILMIVVISL